MGISFALRDLRQGGSAPRLLVDVEVSTSETILVLADPWVELPFSMDRLLQSDRLTRDERDRFTVVETPSPDILKPAMILVLGRSRPSGSLDKGYHRGSDKLHLRESQPV